MSGPRLWLSLVQYGAALQQSLGGELGGVWKGSGSEVETAPNFAFSEEWMVLGPFQVGTREAQWGADPLELYGGFRALEYDQRRTFRSSLAVNGTIDWSTHKAKLPNPNQSQEAHCELSVNFPDIEWGRLQSVYGWPALQWQGWARGSINVGVSGGATVALYAAHVLELYVDGKLYFGGDFYGYDRAALSLHLGQGTHIIDVRLVRDVRRDGALGDPSVDVKLRLESRGPLVMAVLPDSHEDYIGLLMSDVTGGPDGQLASPYSSAYLRNDAPSNAYIYQVDVNHNQCFTELLPDGKPVKLVTGQTRPVGFRVACVPPIVGKRPVVITFKYIIDGDDVPKQTYLLAKPPSKGLYDPQKVTFLHPAGMVSYAILRPPSLHAHCPAGNNITAPVMLALHGAGVEADSDPVRHSLDNLPDLCAWVLFPTGVTPWSGDDWHTWGLADVEAAISAIPAWIKAHDWTGPGVDIKRWVVAGHSNGGQGAWYMLTHRPDNVIAAAPLSAYSSIQTYVPYTLWQPADPGKWAVLQSALGSYRHELLLDNVRYIPTLIQHGSEDDNVPVYHSRNLAQLLEQSGPPEEIQYVEMPRKPHWWPGVLTTAPLEHFFRHWLNTGGPPLTNAPAVSEAKGKNFEVPENMRVFEVVSMGFGDVGSKNGVELLQNAVPGQLALIAVSFDPVTLACVLRDSNVRLLRLPFLFKRCSFLSVGGQEVAERPLSEEGLTLKKNAGGKWRRQEQEADEISGLFEREGRQLGAMDAILRTQGAFQITHLSQAGKDIALQISRNLCQYFGADTIVNEDYEEDKAANSSNVITVAIGTDLPNVSYHPIDLYHDRIEIADLGPIRHAYSLTDSPINDGLAAIFLRPLPHERLELVCWGVNLASLEIAARLVPMMTGTGQADFVVADRKMLLKGVQGSLAMGFFDEHWNVSRNAYFS